MKLGDHIHTKTLNKLDRFEGALVDSGVDLSVIGENQSITYAKATGNTITLTTFPSL